MKYVTIYYGTVLFFFGKSAKKTTLNTALITKNEKVIAVAAALMKQSMHKLDFTKLVVLCL